jgi:hypothetical protein
MSKKQDYDSLESQIGEMGGIQQEETSLGKLEHFGKTKEEQLSSQERDELEAFRKRAEKKTILGYKANEEEQSITSIGEGWMPIDREEMGIRSQFYPEDWVFYIRPATVQAIKNWTAIDEERPDVVNNVFNDIIRTCVKIQTSNSSISWQNINSWDRFWFTLKIREITFITGEQKIEFEDTCSECEEDLIYTLKSENLFYEFPDEDLIDNYWNGINWVIDPSEYDLEDPVITLYTPTIGKDQAIIDWATNKVRAGGKIDETFITYLVWMLPKASKDAQMLDRQIQKLYKEYKSWSVDMFSFMQDVVRNITINPSEKLRQTCPHCGAEATSNVQFPNGIKAIFNVATKAKKFGSR